MVQQMIEDGHSFFAREIVDATFYDTGNPLEYIKTTLDFALNHPEFGAELAAHVKKRLQ
jgi:UTP-glucose-1-phosphate uridylyltransferase